MKNPFSLKGEIALITGGGSGLGLGMAKSLVAAGAKVVLVGRREDVLKTAAKSLGKSATFVAHDINDLNSASNLAAQAGKKFGPISILINNAGIHLKKPAIDISPEEFQAVIQTHVSAGFALTRAVLPGMIRRKHGNILFTASMASLFGIPLVAAYSAAKTAQLGLVRTLAVELGAHNVRVNAIAPGWIYSEMSAKALAGDPARKAKILGRTPLNRLGDPEDIGQAAVYLCSPAARFVTGVVLPVDGGVSIGF